MKWVQWMDENLFKRLLELILNLNLSAILLLLQLERLEEVFRESKYPDVYRREEIAAQLDIKEEVVRVSARGIYSGYATGT